MNARDFSPAVKVVAWGYILLYFDFNIGTLDLLPAWLGYLLFLEELPVIGQVCPTAKLLRPFAVGLAAWNAVTWIFGSEWYPAIIGVIEGVVSLYFHFQLLTELAALAERFGCPQQKKLLALRTVNTVLQTVFILLGQLLAQAEGIAVILLITNLVVLVWICSVLFGLRGSLEETQATL